jgi:hypothetical protein
VIGAVIIATSPGAKGCGSSIGQAGANPVSWPAVGNTLVAAAIVIVRMVYVEDVLGDHTITEPTRFEEPAPDRDPEDGVPGSPTA